MTDLLGRGPMGQKQPKPPKKPRKGLPPRSKKRLAYLASDERKRGLEHMAKVARCGCLICGAPAEVHHLPDPRSDFRTIPLCPMHHRREYGAQAFHYSPRAFYAAHGNADALLARTAALIRAFDMS